MNTTNDTDGCPAGVERAPDTGQFISKVEGPKRRVELYLSTELLRQIDNMVSPEENRSTLVEQLLRAHFRAMEDRPVKIADSPINPVKKSLKFCF